MDERLRAAAHLFPKVQTGADIGANHGLLACRLLRTGKAARMWVTDLSADSLEQARENVLKQGFSERVSFGVGDGFAALPERVDAAAILGMGGDTLSGIIESVPAEKLPQYLLVSSHTDQDALRQSLCRRGYTLRAENVVQSGGRYYVIHLAERTGDHVPLDKRTLFLGPCLMRDHSALYRAYLERRLSAYRPSRSPEGLQRYEWLREEAARAAADSQSSP